MKAFIWAGIFLGGIIGGAMGMMLDHGNGLGMWTLLLSTVGSLAGIWLAVKANDYI